LSVSARDKASAKEQSIRIEGSGGLAKSEIERMVREAESHAAEDKAERHRIEKRNTLDNLIYQAEKTLRENAEKASGADGDAGRGAGDAAKRDLDSPSADALEAARRHPEQQLHRLAETLYKSQGGAAPGAGAADGDAGRGGSGGGNGDVVDAE